MSPLLASMLEAVENQPGSMDSVMTSSTASMAISHIRRLEAALLGIYRASDEGSYQKITAAAAWDITDEAHG